MSADDTKPTAPASANVTKTDKPEAGASAGNGKKPDDPSEFGTGFVAGVVAAVREQEVGGADAYVAGAVALGWYIAALAHPGNLSQTAAAVRGDLMTITALADRHAVEFCLSQVQVAFARLKDLVEKTTLTLPPLQALQECLEHEAKRQEAAAEVDAKALAVLSAVDSRLGKAYGAGRALLTITTRPQGQVKLADHLSKERVAPVAAALDDISSALPPHAGHSVRASLYEWQLSVATNSSVVSDESTVWLQLARQGELWRSLLSSEKAGLDMLEIDDYIDAADRLSARVRTVAVRLLKQFWWAALAAVVLFAGGIALLLRDTNSAAAIVAGAGGILASLGLTWKGAGQALGQLTGKLERPLWGAELDTAITQAITLLARDDAKRRDTALHRREVAVALGSSVQGSAMDSGPGG